MDDLEKIGSEVDPISGNEVPAGAMPHEVRDDVPAMLSEGEFVIPADVVRYIGLDKLRKMRDMAKKGLADMEAEGQIGGEPAIGPDPEELLNDSAEPLEMAEGGVVPSQYSSRQRVQRPRRATASAGYEMRKYVSEDGRTVYIPVIGGQPMMDIPEGFTQVDRLGSIKKEKEEDSTKVESAGVESAQTQSTSSDSTMEATPEEQRVLTDSNKLKKLGEALGDDELIKAGQSLAMDEIKEGLKTALGVLFVPGYTAGQLLKAASGFGTEGLGAGLDTEKMLKLRKGETDAQTAARMLLEKKFGQQDPTTGRYIADAFLMDTKMTNGSMDKLIGELKGKLSTDMLSGSGMDLGTAYAQAMAGVMQSPAGQIEGGMEKVNAAIDRWGTTFFNKDAQYDVTVDKLGFFDSIADAFGIETDATKKRDEMYAAMDEAAKKRDAEIAAKQEEERKAEEARKLEEARKEAEAKRQANAATTDSGVGGSNYDYTPGSISGTDLNTGKVYSGRGSSSSYTPSSDSSVGKSYSVSAVTGGSSLGAGGGNTSRGYSYGGWAKGGLVTRKNIKKNK